MRGLFDVLVTWSNGPLAGGAGKGYHMGWAGPWVPPNHLVGKLMNQREELGGRIIEMAEAGRLDEIEALWLERLEELPTQPVFIRDWLRMMRRSGSLDRAESLVGMLAESRLDGGKPRLALRVLLSALPLMPYAEPLRPWLLRALHAVNPDQPMLDELLKVSGLSEDGPLVDSYKSFVEWQKLAPGQAWQHTDWGEGLVVELDTAGRRVVFHFANNPAKEMTVDGARKYLKYLPPESFLGLRTREPETLAKLAETAPAELVKRALADQPNQRMRQAELKQLIIGGVIDGGDWNSWWARARQAVKLDPYIDFDPSGGAHAVLGLRVQPRTFEEEIRDRFFAVDADNATRAEIIRQLARKPGQAQLQGDLARRMADQLNQAMAQASEGAPAGRLELAYMMADLAAVAPEAKLTVPDAGALLAQIHAYDDLTEIEHVDYAIQAMEALIERDGEDGCRQAAGLLPRAPVRLAQAIWQALDHEQHLEDAVRAVQRLLDFSLTNPDTWAWAVRAILDGSWGHLDDYFPAQAIVPDVLDEMEQWQRLVESEDTDAALKATARSLLSRMRTLLAADRCAALAKAVEAMPREMAQRLRRRIERHDALPAAYKAQADRAIRLTRRDLEEAAGAVDQAEEEHLCTGRTYGEKVAELREITSVKIPKNSRVIEEARMEGDLRENAGYQYAKEEQKMLVQTQATLTSLLSRARIVTADQVDTERICFGVRFRARNLSNGAEESYTVLGRWEADADRHIVSRQAPMAVQFMDRRVGDQVTIQHPGGGETPYEILEIENALADGEWDRP